VFLESKSRVQMEWKDVKLFLKMKIKGPNASGTIIAEKRQGRCNGKRNKQEWPIQWSASARSTVASQWSGATSGERDEVGDKRVIDK
jgi:hypothetical protein